MDTIKKNTIEIQLREATVTLLKLARNSCWNTISENTGFFLTKIEKDPINIFDKRIGRQKTKKVKETKTLNALCQDLLEIFEDLYDVILYVFESKKNQTIIEIQYYPKSSLEPEIYLERKDNDPMLHCKIGIPPYALDSDKNYDINWERGGVKHEWHMFWYKRKFAREQRKRNAG